MARTRIELNEADQEALEDRVGEGQVAQGGFDDRDGDVEPGDEDQSDEMLNFYSGTLLRQMTLKYLKNCLDMPRSKIRVAIDCQKNQNKSWL